MRSESDKLVAELRCGKDVDYLVFEDEGHDLTRLDNKVKGYQAITGLLRHPPPTLKTTG